MAAHWIDRLNGSNNYHQLHRRSRAYVPAYEDGGATVDGIEQTLLEATALAAKIYGLIIDADLRTVEEAEKNGIECFGPRRAEGDMIAVDSVMDVFFDQALNMSAGG